MTLTIEEVQSRFDAKGFTLISKEYQDTRGKLKFACKNHPENVRTSSLEYFQRGVSCRRCVSIIKRLPIVRKQLEAIGCSLVSTEYVNNTTPIQFRCHKHPNEVQTGILSNLQKRGCTLCNREKQTANMSGEKHHNWKGGVLSEVEHARNSKKYRVWRTLVFERDKYRCSCCGTKSRGNLQAHHILNFSKHPKLRYDVSNGISLCVDCHSANTPGGFHNIYGTYNNDKEQLKEYLETKNTYLKGVFNFEEYKLGGIY